MTEYLETGNIYCGKAEEQLQKIKPDSVAVSIWSPPYHIGKQYEEGQSCEEWEKMLQTVIAMHRSVLKPGGFMAINMNDILCFPDSSIPRIQANNVTRRKCGVTAEDVRKAQEEHPEFNRKQLGKLLGCSEQTIDRRLHGNNIRGGKYNVQTRVKLTGGMLEEMAITAGLYLYDRRVWVKGAAWANSTWASNSYRSVDEFEYVYIFWKPGITKVDRNRLEKKEWTKWGSRAVWNIRSVQKNDDHEAKFPVELPRRIIKMLSEEGETILDCFIGSGTTAVAAVIENRHYIGIEKEKKYVDLAKRRLHETVEQMKLLNIPRDTEQKLGPLFREGGEAGKGAGE